MNIACLILGFRGATILARSQPLLAAAGWDVYVHLDRKADPREYAQALGSAALGCFFVEDPLAVFWGGYSMIEAQLKLISTARSQGRYDRFVLLSDDAFPILPPEALAKHIATNEDLITAQKQAPGSEFFRRYTGFYYYDHPITNPRSPKPGSAEIDVSFEENISEIATMRRWGKKPLDVYFGSQFWSLTAESVNLIVDKIERDMYLRKSFQYSSLSDELMFQSILGNYKLKSDCMSGPVYADFAVPVGPRIITSIDDLPFDLRPTHAFIRKFAPASTSLLDLMQANLRANKTIYGTRPEDPLFGTVITNEVGTPVVNLLLNAPAEPDAIGWHTLEPRQHGYFRWTAQSDIAWDLGPVIYPPGIVRFVIPLAMPQRQTFVDGCRMTFQGQVGPLRQLGHALIAEFGHTGSGRMQVALQQPALRSPRENSGVPDDRKMGLAVVAKSA